MLASVLTIAFVFLINRNSIDLRTAIQASVLTLITIGILHSFRVPWLLFRRLNAKEKPLSDWWGILGVIFFIAFIICVIYTAVWFYTMQPPVELVRSPDLRDARIAELESKLKDLTEPGDSLRNRTFKLANEVDSYFKQRDKHAPSCIQNSKMTPDEQAAVLKPCTVYYFETEGQFQQTFASQIFSTILEFEGKGLDADSLKSCVKGGRAHNPALEQGKCRFHGVRVNVSVHVHSVLVTDGFMLRCWDASLVHCVRVGRDDGGHGGTALPLKYRYESQKPASGRGRDSDIYLLNLSNIPGRDYTRCRKYRSA